jgi:hypothetical protein
MGQESSCEELLSTRRGLVHFPSLDFYPHWNFGFRKLPFGPDFVAVPK